MLRSNQRKAIQTSIDNDFASGIHFHATGTGKSWIAFHILREFFSRYPKQNVMWICEQKSILLEQFDYHTMVERNFQDLKQSYQIINYAKDKSSAWYSSVNSSRFWGKPILLVINRAFLVSQLKYRKLTVPFDLIIHDECHSITNGTTQTFYKYMLHRYPTVRCIGFSATPVIKTPFDTILSSYSIYDSFVDDVICEPRIVWFKSNRAIRQTDLITLSRPHIDELPYKKIIVWCGMIQLCKDMARKWQRYYEDWTICIDVSSSSGGSGGNSNSNRDLDNDFGDIDQFRAANEKALLFCACKHREGSDIKNLDGCIFLDKVSKRNAKTFVQCIGRVLRKDPQGKKKYGLIIDSHISSSLKVCDRINRYLCHDSTTFPWSIANRQVDLGQYAVQSYMLQLKRPNTMHLKELRDKSLALEDSLVLEDSLRNVVKGKFVRSYDDTLHTARLKLELDLFEEKDLFPYLLRAVEILELTDHIAHVTRGSCGSSLTCYLLGISHVDPVKYNISFARFLNTFRDTLPDIDFDFPYHVRDEVFMKIEERWPNQVARISNHVHYHEKSALRAALRESGVRHFVKKSGVKHEISKLDASVQKRIRERVQELDNTFRCYSLHCGGIVFYPEGVPKNLKLDNDSIMSQISLDKRDVAEQKNFKIDILASRGISQLLDTSDTIDFENFQYDEETFDMLAHGDNIGITLGESPLMRSTLMKVLGAGHRSIEGIALCLAIIRPAAAEARSSPTLDGLVYDDDAIRLIADLFSCSESEADQKRRQIAKGKGSEVFADVDRTKENRQIIDQLKHLRKYGFCKAHAYSYAQLVWHLALAKRHRPEQFWRATLKHCKSSYRKWVHIHHARQHNVLFQQIHTTDSDVSIYAENRRKKIMGLTLLQQLKTYGYWHMKTKDFFPGCFLTEELRTGAIDQEHVDVSKRSETHVNDTRSEEQVHVSFRGLIASSRNLSQSKFVVFLGYDTGKYVELLVHHDDMPIYTSHVGMRGKGVLLDGLCHVEEGSFSFF